MIPNHKDKRHECDCPQGKCQPERNEGCVCWRSGSYIPRGYFSPAESEEAKHGS